MCLFSPSGDVLIQQRATGKSIDPGLWDLSAGGAVRAGETSPQGASRKLAEELGVSIDFTGARPVITATHPDAFFDIYLADLPNDDLSGLALQPEEVQSVRWASLEEILTMVADGRCRVEGWPWRMDFSRADSRLMVSRGRPTSISFFLRSGTLHPLGDG